MAAQYTEIDVPPGTARADVLDMLSQGEGWAFVQIKLTGGDDVEDTSFSLVLEIGGMIQTNASARALLERVLSELPA